MNQKHDKQIVLQKGLQLFCNKGYKALGVDEICEITGMTKGAFYNAFKSKEQFLVEALQLYSENNVKRIERELMPSADFSSIEILKNFYLKMIQSQPKINFMGCFVNNMMSELGTVNPVIGEITSLEYDKFIDAIEPIIQESQKEGGINKTISSRDIAMLLHSTFYGVLTIVKSSKDFQQGINTMNILFANLK